MKTISIKLCIGVLLMLSVLSCSEEKLPVYEDVSRVYFYWTKPAYSYEEVNSIMVSMGYDDPIKADSIIGIKIRTMGLLSDTDRPVTAEVIRSESTAIPGQDIEIISGSILAGTRDGVLLVKIKNTEKLKTNTLQARIRLTPNEYFHVDWTESPDRTTTNGLEYNISFDAKTDMPNLWKDAPQMISYWGTWSRVKELAIYDALGVTRDFFTYDPATEDPVTVANNRVPQDLAYGMIAVVNRYLRAYEETKGTPLTDENGFIVKVGLDLN